jgi:hypothetical protein
MTPTFEQRGDAFALGLLGGHRTKGTHQVGVHGKAEFVPTPNSGFTGIFQTGCKNAIVRLSSAVEPDAADIIAPSVAFKCLRSH